MQTERARWPHAGRNVCAMFINSVFLAMSKRSAETGSFSSLLKRGVALSCCS